MSPRYPYLKWLSIINKFILVLLVLSSCLIIASIVINSRKNKRPEHFIKPENQQVSFQEKFRALEYSGEKKKTSWKAEKYFVDEDKNQHLEGQVEISQEEQEAPFLLQAEKVVIGAEGRNLKASGGVKIRSADLLIEAQSLEYDFKEKIIKSERANIRWQNLNFKSSKLNYSFLSRLVILEDGIIGQSIGSEPGLNFRAQTLTLEEETRFLKAKELDLSSDNFILKAKEGEIYLSPTGGNFERIDLKLGAEVHWSTPKKEAELQMLDLASEEMSLLRIGSARILRNETSFQIQGRGEKWEVKGKGENLILSFSDNQQVEKLSAKNGQMNLSQKNGQRIELSGTEMVDNVSSSRIELSGVVKAKLEKYTIQTAQLSFSLSDESLEARPGFIELQPDFFEEIPVFFEREQSILVTGLKILSQPERIHISEKVKIWQGETYIICGQAILEKETGRVVLKDKVAANLTSKNSKGEVERISFASEEASLETKVKRLVLRGAVNLKKDELNLQADEMELIFGEKISNSNKVSVLMASGHVLAYWKGYKGKSQTAHYETDKNILIMSGLPELSTPEGDHLEADKLTLQLADDRILIENQNRERSLTILVRRK
jgi:lipopolysaccharide export system protein LptA